MLDEVGAVSVHWTATPEPWVRLPRSTVRLPLPASGEGAQMVAVLPSTAASAYIPASSELAVAGLQRARFVVGVRSGRRVGIVSDEPVATTWVLPDDSTGIAAPLRTVTLVVLAPICTSKILPCQCRPLRVTPSESCGGNIGSRCTRSALHRNPVNP